MHQILVVDDSAQVLDIIRDDLGRDFVLTTVTSKSEAMTLVERIRFDLVVLDIGLPDGDGTQLCRSLREMEHYKATPIILLTGMTDLQDKLKGFSAGADDYVVKPFESMELRARIEAKLSAQRRLGEAASLLVRGIKVDSLSQRVFLEDDREFRELDLTGYEFRILLHLLKNRGRTVSRAEILESVWGRKVHVLDRTVDRHISNLRHKLGEHASRLKSQPGEGYVFDDTKTVNMSAG